jgi:hypothetical protein
VALKFVVAPGRDLRHPGHQPGGPPAAEHGRARGPMPDAALRRRMAADVAAL